MKKLLGLIGLILLVACSSSTAEPTAPIATEELSTPTAVPEPTSMEAEGTVDLQFVTEEGDEWITVAAGDGYQYQYVLLYKVTNVGTAETDRSTAWFSVKCLDTNHFDSGTMVIPKLSPGEVTTQRIPVYASCPEDAEVELHVALNAKDKIPEVNEDNNNQEGIAILHLK